MLGDWTQQRAKSLLLHFPNIPLHGYMYGTPPPSNILLKNVTYLQILYAFLETDGVAGLPAELTFYLYQKFASKKNMLLRFYFLDRPSIS